MANPRKKLNRPWRRIGKKLGAPRSFTDPVLLWRACVGYFEWVEENPIQVAKLMVVDNVIRRPIIEKPRPMTIQAMCAHINVSRRAWQLWRNDPKLAGVIELVESIIYAQKFDLATVGVYNANIITRDLNLAEKREISGPGGGPIPTISSDMTPEEAAELYSKTRSYEE